MPGIARKYNKHFVGMVITDSEEEDKDISYCENCYKVGVLNKLRERVYLDMSGKLLVNPPPDADDWLQCWKCGYIIAVREAREKEGYPAYWELNPLIILMIMARVQYLVMTQRIGTTD